MIKLGRMKFFKEGMKRANKEAKDYKFPEKSLDKRTKKDDKPIDARNHGVNAVEFIASALPKRLKTKRY